MGNKSNKDKETVLGDHSMNKTRNYSLNSSMSDIVNQQKLLKETTVSNTNNNNNVNDGRLISEHDYVDPYIEKELNKTPGNNNNNNNEYNHSDFSIVNVAPENNALFNSVINNNNTNNNNNNNINSNNNNNNNNKDNED